MKTEKDMIYNTDDNTLNIKDIIIDLNNLNRDYLTPYNLMWHPSEFNKQYEDQAEWFIQSGKDFFKNIEFKKKHYQKRCFVAVNGKLTPQNTHIICLTSSDDELLQSFPEMVRNKFSQKIEKDGVEPNLIKDGSSLDLLIVNIEDLDDDDHKLLQIQEQKIEDNFEYKDIFQCQLSTKIDKLPKLVNKDDMNPNCCRTLKINRKEVIVICAFVEFQCVESMISLTKFMEQKCMEEVLNGDDAQKQLEIEGFVTPTEDQLINEYRDQNHEGKWQGWVYSYPMKSKHLIAYFHPLYLVLKDNQIKMFQNSSSTNSDVYPIEIVDPEWECGDEKFCSINDELDDQNKMVVKEMKAWANQTLFTRKDLNLKHYNDVCFTINFMDEEEKHIFCTINVKQSEKLQNAIMINFKHQDMQKKIEKGEIITFENQTLNHDKQKSSKKKKDDDISSDDELEIGFGCDSNMWSEGIKPKKDGYSVKYLRLNNIVDPMIPSHPQGIQGYALNFNRSIYFTLDEKIQRGRLPLDGSLKFNIFQLFIACAEDQICNPLQYMTLVKSQNILDDPEIIKFCDQIDLFMRINAIPLDNNNCLALQFEQSLAEYLNTVIVCFENYENMLSYKNELNELRDESWKIPLNDPDYCYLPTMSVFDTSQARVYDSKTILEGQVSLNSHALVFNDTQDILQLNEIQIEQSCDKMKISVQNIQCTIIDEPNIVLPWDKNIINKTCCFSVIMQSEKEIAICQEKNMYCQRDNKILQKSLLQKCLIANHLYIHRGMITNQLTSGLPNIQEVLQDQKLIMNTFDDESKLQDDEYKKIDEYGRVVIEKQTPNDLPATQDLVEQGKLLAPLQNFDDFVFRYDDDSVAAKPSNDYKQQVQFTVSLKDVHNGYLDELYYCDSFDFGYLRKGISAQQYETLAQQDHHDADRGDYRGFIQTASVKFAEFHKINPSYNYVVLFDGNVTLFADLINNVPFYKQLQIPVTWLKFRCDGLCSPQQFLNSFYENARYDKSKRVQRYFEKILTSMDMNDPIESERQCIVLEYQIKMTYEGQLEMQFFQYNQKILLL